MANRKMIDRALIAISGKKNGRQECRTTSSMMFRNGMSAALDAALTPSEDVGALAARPVHERSEAARRARDLLQAAHDACFKAPHRDILGMSSGPFSGVNEVLGLIAGMDGKLAAQSAQIVSLSAKVAEVEVERDEARAELYRQDIRRRECLGVGLPENAQWLLEAKDQWQDRASTAEDRAGRLERLIGQMVEALAPFARAADEFDCFTHDPESMFIWAINGGDPKLPPPRVSVGDLRRARTALTETEGRADA